MGDSLKNVGHDGERRANDKDHVYSHLPDRQERRAASHPQSCRVSCDLYREVLRFSAGQGQQDWTQLAFHNDVMVGAICTRKDLEDANKVYIMTVGVLAPYRDNLIGSKLLWKIIEKCNEEAEVKQIYLHVQQGNDDAVNFYAKFGFEVGDEVKDYYKRIDPPHAIILYKNIK